MPFCRHIPRELVYVPFGEEDAITVPIGRDKESNNNYLLDKKKVKLFFTGFFPIAKKSCFIASAP
jgi:hypothetical protein